MEPYQVTMNIGEKKAGRLPRVSSATILNAYYPELEPSYRSQQMGAGGERRRISSPGCELRGRAGVDYFICRFGALDQFDQVQRFAKDVLPAFQTRAMHA